MNEIMRKYAGILYYTGYMSIIGSFLFLPSLLMALMTTGGGNREILSFWFPSLVLLATGLFLRILFIRYKNEEMNLYYGAVLTVFGWLWIIVVSSFPFLIGLNIPFHHAFFESMSGWTTTGLSVLDVTSVTSPFLLWRSIMQFAGGAGLAIIMLSVFGIQAGFGSSIMEAEGRSDKMIPNVISSAKVVMRIYAAYAITGILLLKGAGMSFFDAVNHTFAAISTGGFATHPQSIGYWNSWPVYFVILLLMFVGNLNFITAYEVFHGNIKKLFKNTEVRLFAVMALASSLLLFFSVSSGESASLGYRIKAAIFESISGLTTTGFNIHPYSRFSEIALVVISILMITGGGAYSTSGGIKQIRVIVILKELWFHIRRQLLPKNTIQSKGVYYGGGMQWITTEMVHKIFAFVFTYLLILFAGTLVLMTAGHSFTDSFFEFASSLGTVGLSVGVTSATAPSYILWTEIAGMFLGRLEIFVIFVGLGKVIADIKLYRYYNQR